MAMQDVVYSVPKLMQVARILSNQLRVVQLLGGKEDFIINIGCCA